MLYSKNIKRSSGYRHIEIKYLVIRDKVRYGLAFVEHIGSETMIADPLAKCLSPKVLNDH